MSEPEKLPCCLWCGSRLVPSGNISWMCENDGCVLSNHSMAGSSWKNAWGWKEIDSLVWLVRHRKKEIEELKKEIERLKKPREPMLIDEFYPKGNPIVYGGGMK